MHVPAGVRHAAPVFVEKLGIHHVAPRLRLPPFLRGQQPHTLNPSTGRVTQHTIYQVPYPLRRRIERVTSDSLRCRSENYSATQWHRLAVAGLMRIEFSAHRAVARLLILTTHCLSFLIPAQPALLPGLLCASLAAALHVSRLLPGFPRIHAVACRRGSLPAPLRFRRRLRIYDQSRRGALR